MIPVSYKLSSFGICIQNRQKKTDTYWNDSGPWQGNTNVLTSYAIDKTGHKIKSLLQDPGWCVAYFIYGGIFKILKFLLFLCALFLLIQLMHFVSLIWSIFARAIKCRRLWNWGGIQKKRALSWASFLFCSRQRWWERVPMRPTD